MLTSLICLLVAQQGPDYAQKITFDEPAMRAEAIVKVLSEKTKIPLRTSGETAEEVLLVRVKDVPAGTLMRKISAVTDAEWVEEKGLIVLKRSAETDRKQRADELKTRTEFVKKAIQKLYDTVKAESELDEKSAQRLLEARKAAEKKYAETRQYEQHAIINNHNNSLPYGRAIARLAMKLDPSVLAAVEGNSRVVFSNHPTRMQKALPPNAETVLKQLIREHQATVDAAGNLPGGFGKSPVISYGWAGMHSEPLRSKPTTMLLIAQRSDSWGELALEIRLGAPDGPVVYSGLVFLSNYGSFVPPGPREIPEGIDKSTEIVLSPISKEFLAARRTATTDKLQMPALSEELHNRLLDPVQFDPLSLIPTDIVRSIAGGRNIVALIPDSAFNGMWVDFTKKQTVQTVWPTFSGWRGSKLWLDEGWALAKPVQPWAARRERSPREATKDFVTAVAGRGYPRLEDRAALARACPYLDFMSIPRAYAGLLCWYISGVGWGGEEDRKLLIFLDTLSDPQKKRLFAGETLAASTMNDAQIKALSSYVYNQHLTIAFTTPEGYQAYHGGLMACEPSQGLPTGNMREASISLKVKTTPMAFAWTKESGKHLYPRKAVDVANDIKRAGQPLPDDPDDGYVLAFDRFIYGEMTSSNFRITFPNKAIAEDSLEDADVDVKKKPEPLEKMPDAFRKAVDEALKKIKG